MSEATIEPYRETRQTSTQTDTDTDLKLFLLLSTEDPSKPSPLTSELEPVTTAQHKSLTAATAACCTATQNMTSHRPGVKEELVSVSLALSSYCSVISAE